MVTKIALLVGVALALRAAWARIGRVEAEDAVSSVWIREQIRERGHRGFDGAYQEDV